LQEQAHDGLEGGGWFFAQFRKWRIDWWGGKQFKNKRLKNSHRCLERQKLMENLSNRGNGICGLIFIYEK